MSQHIVCLKTDKSQGPVTFRVQLGWDKPCSEFYLVILEEPPAGSVYDEDRILYSNDYDPISSGQELGYFKNIAKRFGCEVPDSMWRAAYQDRDFNVVNKTVFYSPAGDVIDPF